jgi:hyperosmotically inducible protein
MNKLLGLTLLGLVLATAACERRGPAERAGAEIDQAVEDVRDGASDLADKAQDLADDAADAVDEAVDN